MVTGTSYLSNDYRLDARPPMLVAAASESARSRAMHWLEESGWRASAMPIDGAIDRLKRQASASGLWIELDPDDDSEALDRLLDHANGEAAAGRMPTIVAAPLALIDSLAARLDAEATYVLIDPDLLERSATLALATAQAKMPATLHDVSRGPGSLRLKQLSDEVGRIAQTLARLSTGPDAPGSSVERPQHDPTEIVAVSGDTVRTIIRARRLRARFFDEELFADPAWDMLLDLLAAEIAQHRVPVSSLCIAAAVPATTALRWIKTMTDNGLFLRRADPHDGRRVFIELAPAASVGIRRYFSEVGALAAV
ncbi:MAG TPA: MarR family transcriptional regulator [Sphingomicrobium sp.]|nr:MarR family transcriptional regulator [Sphingomicrobium sp.]